MRRLVPLAALVALLPLSLPLSAQEAGTPLRALHTADDARDWAAVGRLDTGISFCSGTLIAPDLVLTAAHCLFSTEGRRLLDADLVFSAGLRHGRAEATRGVVQSTLPAGYVRPMGPPDLSSISMDIALLRLNAPVSVTIVRPMAAGAAAALRDSVTLVSYGADRETFPSIEEGCRLLSREGAMLVLSCSVVPGSSGAPVVVIGPNGPEIIAVVSGAADIDGRMVSVAVVTEALLPGLMGARPNAGIRVPQGSSITVRRVGEGGTARGDIGARFLRP